MPASRRSRSRGSPSPASRIARWLAGEGEKPRKRLWQDELTAALLLPLGLWSVVVGLLHRSALAEGFVWFETTALIVVAAGMAALQTGVCGAICVLWPRVGMGDESDFPVMLSGLPFLALGLGGILLIAGCPDDWVSPGTTSRLASTHPVVCAAAVAGGFTLSLLVPLAVAIGRAISRRNE